MCLSQFRNSRYRYIDIRNLVPGWVIHDSCHGKSEHIRKSNTEPIIRVYSEASTMEQADELGKKLMQVVYDMQ